MAEPRNSDAVADTVGGDVRSERLDAADNFVAGDDGVFDIRQLAIDDVKVSPANAASAHAHADLSATRKRVGALMQLQGRTRRRQNHRVHVRFSQQPRRQKALVDIAGLSADL